MAVIVTEHVDGVDAARTPHRPPACEADNDNDQRRNRRHRRRVVWRDAVELIGNEAAEPQRSQETNDDADRGHHRGIAQDEPVDLATRRAKRHAYTDLR